jgi:hypothetical protein
MVPPLGLLREQRGDETPALPYLALAIFFLSIGA